MPSTNRTVIPEAKTALNKFKYEVSRELGVTLTDGYNGNIAARDAGRIGGQMVRRMIEIAERNLSGTR